MKQFMMAIVTENDADANELQTHLMRYAEEKGLTFLFRRFANGEDFLTRNKGLFDIVYFDLDTPDAAETARKFRETDRTTVLMIITARAQNALKGYDMDASGCVLKPLQSEKIAAATERAIRLCRARSAEQYVTITSERKAIKIEKERIRYVEVRKHGITYHTTDGDFKVYGTLAEAATKINSDSFVPCNSCYLVNLRYATAIDRNTVRVGDSRLLISRPRRKSFSAAFTSFSGGLLC